MPQPIVLQDTSGLGSGIQIAGGALAQALAQRQQAQRMQRQQEQYSSILSETIGQLDANASPMEYMNAVNKAISKGLPVDQALTASKLYEPAIKEKLKTEGQLALARQFGLLGGESYVDVQEGIQREVASQGLDFNNISEDKLVRMQAIPSLKDYAKAELERRGLQDKRETKLWEYKPTQKFLETVEEEAKDAEFGNEVAKEVETLVRSGEVSPDKLRVFLASKYGENVPFLFSGEAAKLKFLEKLQAKGLKNYFPRPTEKEFFFINAAQAQLGKTDEANLAVAKIQQKFNDIPLQAARFSQEVIEENGGVPPRNIAAKVREKMKEHKNELINESAKIVQRYGNEKEKRIANQHLGIKGETVEALAVEGYNVGDVAKDTETGEEYIFTGRQWVRR